MATDMRSLPPEAKYGRRVQVIDLRRAGRSYLQIALQLGLSRTGVFDICKRHAAIGNAALRDAPARRGPGQGRRLAPEQERLLRRQIIDSPPDALDMPESLWNRAAVARLIGQRLGIVLPVRTLALYLARWGYAAHRPTARPGAPGAWLLNRWLRERYPLLLARSKAEGGEINWAGDSPLPAEGSGLRPAPAAPRRARGGRRGDWVISALNNKGQLRWSGFRAPLDAETLLAFLRRLVQGAGKKVFLIMDDLPVPDDGTVQAWLVEHEDLIETFHLPGRQVRPGS